MNTPTDLLYTPSDEWVRDNGDGTFTIGITDYAQHELGDIVYVELPEIGQSVAPDGTFGVVESVKAVGELHAPVGGEVVATNQETVQTPELVNQSPFENAWLIQVKPSETPDLSALMNPEAYAAYRAR
jgi:glycine cleavage system H protein